MQSTALKEKLNAQALCDRRDEIIALVTQAVEKLGEAEMLLKTISTYGFSFDRNTFYSPSEGNNRLRTTENFRKQIDRKIWDHIIELGEFRELMSVTEQRKVDKALENVPPVKYGTVLATFQTLLSNRPNMLQDLVETAFLERSSGFKSNEGNKIGNRHIINGVFCKYGFCNYGSYAVNRLEDITKAIALLTGLEKPHITNILREKNEYLAFEGKVKYKAFQKGTVHVQILDKTLLDKLNDVLAGAMGAKIGAAA